MSVQQSAYSLRQLQLEDWQLLKTKRLTALEREPGVFGGSFAEESKRSDSDWQNRLTSSTKAYFGLFLDNKACVGLTGVVEHKDDHEAVILIASYIDAAHRGKGLSKLLYQARLNWAQDNGYKKAIISHRESNAASKAANQKFGFVYTHTETDVTWPDGAVEDNIYYQLKL